MRSLLLGCAFAALAAPAFAACVESPKDTYTCAGADQTSRVKDKSDGVKVTVEPGAEVTVDGKDAFRLDGNGVSVANDGRIATTDSKKKSKADGVQSEGADLSVVNRGEIIASGKGVKADDANGLTVDNYGRIEGGVEGIDGADGFKLNNRAGARVIGRTDDAVSVGAATITNRGLIESFTDDGIDIDSGLIENYGEIRSNRDSLDDQPAAINVDAQGENDKPAPTLIVKNYGGGLIDGYVGIEFEQDIPSDGKTSSTASQVIENAGLIRGRSGVAVRLGPRQGASTIRLQEYGRFQGDVVFGASDDVMAFESLKGAGALGGVFDGKGGLDLADFSSWLAKSDLTSMALLGDVFTLKFKTLTGAATFASFRNFEQFKFTDGLYRYANGALTAVAPVPLPAALPMLLAGLGGLALFRRRAA